MSLSKLALTAVVISAATGPSLDARADPPPTKQLFGKLDANRDGFVSRDEVPRHKQRLLDRLLRIADKNADGKLNSEEFSNSLRPQRLADPAVETDRPPRRANPLAAFNRLDRDRDGTVILKDLPERIPERALRMLNKADDNGDGKLSRLEFANAVRRINRSKLEPRLNKNQQANPVAIFKKMDANADGKIVADEVGPNRRERFRKLLRQADKDHDGALSAKEFVTFVRSRRNAKQP